MKSTVAQIRQRFDGDVERFADLDTGQGSTVDAPLVLDLVTQAAAATNPAATRVLDVGCGAGNYALKLLRRQPGLDVDLVDLSRPMLERAAERVGEATTGAVQTMQADIRALPLEPERYDIILAAAVLHHLRSDGEWAFVFSKLCDALKPGGSLWISDLVAHDTGAVRDLMWGRYGDYLTDLKDTAYRDRVFDYIEREDSPRPLTYQLDCLREAGFSMVEVLHKNSLFAAFGAIK